METMTRDDVLNLLAEYGLLDTRLTLKELLNKCKLPESSFYKRGLNNHPSIVANRYSVGNKYVYKLQAVSELNRIVEKGVSWDARKNREIL